MEPTLKLYEQQPTQTQFCARVVALQPEARRVALEATYFYPEGGGQPGDTGTLTAAGWQAAVTDTQLAAGVVWHQLEPWPQGLAAGCEVQGAVNWARRFDHMQHHTGEHILQGVICREYGLGNAGFHIGAEAVRLDLPAPLTAAQLERAELLANQAVWQNLPVRAWYPQPEELAALAYRSKKALEGPVRLVEIPGVDLCACCGCHTAHTGEVGLIKIQSAEHYKGGLRLQVLCGGRALAAAQQARRQQADIGALLSASPENTARFVHRLYEEHQALKFQHTGLQLRLFDALAAGAKPGARAVLLVPGLDGDGLHRLAQLLGEKTGALCAAFTPSEKGGLSYCLALPGGDVRPVCRALNEAFGGRGGGKAAICQGSVATEDFAPCEAFLQQYPLP